MSYSQFVKEALQYYKELPPEMNELYSKYSLGMTLPVKPDGRTSDSGELEELVVQASEKTRIKFDVVITDSFARSTNPSVKIIKAEEADKDFLYGKLFKSSDDKFAAYVNANAKYFVTVSVGKGQKANANILFVNNSHLSAQIFVNAEESAKLEISEFYLSCKGSAATVSVLHELQCADKSSLELNMLHNENENTSILNLCKGHTGEKAQLYLNSVYCGGKSTKARSVLDAKGVSSNVDVTELAFGLASQQFDIDTSITNSTPYSSVFLDSGVILDDMSRCMLKGFAKVADKTKGSVSKIVERGILLSKDAHMDALPDLSIDYSNEVKASHSASTTPIDQDALFYLTSRGIEEDQARKLFVSAFISKYISKIGSPAAREIAMSIMLDKLDKKAFGTLTEITPRNVWAVQRPER